MKSLVLAPARRLIQLGSFVVTAPWLLIGWLRCPFGVPFVSCTSCSVTNCPGRWLMPWAVLGVLATHVALRPRFFCGWLCPMGFIQDAIGRIFGRRGRPFAAKSSWPWRILRWGKYAFLVFVIAAVFLYNYPDERAHDYVVRSARVVDFGAIKVALSLGLARYLVRAVLFVVAIVGGLFMVRFWCRYLCPLGALLAAGSRLTLGRLRIHDEVCLKCGRCGPVCPMATRPGTSECISCHECSDVCPEGAIGVRRSVTAAREQTTDS